VQILLNILLQLFYFVGLVFVVGFLISLINRFFYSLVNNNMVVCYATGIIGTPIHELSHAAMCVVFTHRITEIKLFQVDPASGVLGYVNHSYNKRNPYQLMGNYFIGIAPILCGTVIIYFATKFLLAGTFAEMTTYLNNFSNLQNSGFNSQTFGYVFTMFGGMIKSLFSEITVGIKWWIFMLIAFCIALHMNLSGADIKNSLTGLPMVIILLALVNVILGLFVKGAYSSFVHFMNMCGCYLMGTLFLSLVFSLICLAVGGIVKLILTLVGVVKHSQKLYLYKGERNEKQNSYRTFFGDSRLLYCRRHKCLRRCLACCRR
jgi:hypothetical protein